MTSVRDFLTNMAREVVHGKPYDIRLEIEDGGINSYIGFNVALDDWKSKGKIKEVRLHRHTNSPDKLTNRWEFELGSICHEYHSNPDIPLRFTSYGKSAEEAEVEAQSYFEELEKLIQKQTSDYKIQTVKSAEKEKEELLARLAELEKANE